MAGKSTDILTKAATEFATAKAGDMISKIGDKASGNGKSKGDDNKGFIGKTAQKMGEGKGPVKSMLSGAGEAIKGVFKRKGGNKRPTNIVEDCFIGVTPDVAFAAWTQFEEFASFTKGVENVTRGEETPEEELEEGQHPLEGEETGWTGKIDANTSFDSSDFRSTLPRFSPEAVKANQVLVDLLNQIAERKNATPAQIAIGFRVKPGTATYPTRDIRSSARLA